MNQLNRDKMSFGQTIYQKELDRDEAIRQFNAQLAAQREAEARAARAAAAQSANIGKYLGGSGGSGTSTAAALMAPKKNGQGFDFVAANGQSISAAKYAQLTGQSIGAVLYGMGQSGDKYAQQLYNQLKNDPMFGRGNAKYDAKIKATYSPIFWGT